MAAEAAFNFLHELYLLSGNVLLPLICNSFKVPVLVLWERFCRKYGIATLYNDMNVWYQLMRAKDVDAAIIHINGILNNTIQGDWQIYS